MSQGSVVRYRGDDWSFSFTWQTGGPIPVAIPFDGLTPGADLYIGAGSAIPMTGSRGSASIVDRLGGTFIVRTARSVTENIGAGLGVNAIPSVRLHVFVVDEDGERHTLGVLPVQVKRP